MARNARPIGGAVVCQSRSRSAEGRWQDGVGEHYGLVRSFGPGRGSRPGRGCARRRGPRAWGGDRVAGRCGLGAHGRQAGDSLSHPGPGAQAPEPWFPTAAFSLVLGPCPPCRPKGMRSRGQPPHPPVSDFIAFPCTFSLVNLLHFITSRKAFGCFAQVTQLSVVVIRRRQKLRYNALLQ